MSLIYNPGASVDSLDQPGGSLEGFTVTCPSGAGATQADYIAFSEPDGDSYAVWLDIDAAGTAPTGAVYTAASVKIEVDILSTDVDSVVAAAVKAAMEGDAAFNEYDLSIAGAIITAVAKVPGNPVDVSAHDAGDIGGGSFGVSVVQQGADAKVYPGQRVDSLNNNP